MSNIHIDGIVKDVARMLAWRTDEEQAAFFNTMGAELNAWGNHNRKPLENAEMQICYMAGKLDKNGKELIKQLAAFIEIKEQNESD